MPSPSTSPSSPPHPGFGAVTGLHLIADLYGCAEGPILTDAQLLEKTCVTLVREAGLADVGRLFYAFPDGGGVTGTVVLAESHLSLHTWPEHGYVSLDVFVCNYTSDNSDKARRLAGSLMDAFAPETRRVQEVSR
jgi:S-adenosylmethionine decarboxylase